jgi:hypothetical protein
MTDLADSKIDPMARRRASRELIAYFALTYAIAFGIGIAVLLFRPQFEAVFGQLGPLLTSWPYYVAVCAPTISAVLLSALFGGFAGVKTLFAGLIRPFRFRWAFVALLAFPAGLFVWGLAERILSGHSAAHAVDIHAILIAAPLMWFTTAKIVVDPGPWGEETGWRGFALPRLLTRFSPSASALILGVIWGVWHAPAFFASGLTQHGTNFGWFLISVTCLTILMTWIYVHANGNYLVAGFIPHAVNNLMITSQVVTDIKYQAFVMIGIAGLIVASSGPSLRGWRTPAAALVHQTTNINRW